MRTDCVKHAFCSPDQDSPDQSTLEAQLIMNSNTLIAKHTRKAPIRLDMVSHLIVATTRTGLFSQVSDKLITARACFQRKKQIK